MTTNAGRNTNLQYPHPPIHHHQEELADESTDSERRFMEYVIAAGIPLADLEDDD